MNKISVVVLAVIIANTAFSGAFNTINGIKIEDISDEETGLDPEVLSNLASSDYTKPNEINPNFYAKFIVNRTGTLLSVGTFRTLITFTLGGFDRLIMVDVDKKSLAFNREHLDQIRAIAATGTLGEQRKRYQDRYGASLIGYAKSGFTYYWQDDVLWQKITNALAEDRIHVVRGNFGKSSSMTKLYHAISSLQTPVTLDHSNLLQYVKEELTKYAEATLAFFDASLHGDTAVLATIQRRFDGTSRWPFLIGSDPYGTVEVCDVDWNYYYFPYGKAYLNVLDPAYYDRNREGFNTVELAAWQMPLVADKLCNVATDLGIKPDVDIVLEVDRFLAGIPSNNHWQTLPPLQIAQASSEKVWELFSERYFGLAQNFLSHEAYELLKLDMPSDAKALVTSIFKTYQEEQSRPLREWFQRTMAQGEAIFLEAVQKRELDLP